MTDEIRSSSLRKATLFCEDCGFHADVGEWSVSADADRRDLICPDCGRIAVSQPVLGLAA